jgi:transposase
MSLGLQNKEEYMRQPYPTDLTDNQWNRIKTLIEEKTHGKGRPPIHDKREIVNAIFYILQSGCAWRLLPHDFPCWRTVYNHFRDWQNLGTWEKISNQLVKEYREKQGKKEPSGAIIDSQTVRTTEKGVLAEDMMERKKLKAEKDISSLIHRDFCSKQKLLQLILVTKKAL